MQQFSEFSDLKTDLVYYSEFFKLRFPDIFAVSKTNLEANGNKVQLIKGNQNIWCRDYMPIQVDNFFVQFGYKGYGIGYDEYPWLQVPDKCIKSIIPADKLIKNDIVLDGGGIIRSKQHAVVTEKIFLDNPETNKVDLIDRLSVLLGLEVIVLPIEPGDTLGHADGICKFIDDRTVLVNDYSSMCTKEYEVYQKKVNDTFSNAGLQIVPMPYAYEMCPQIDDDSFHLMYPYADDNNPGFGYYINFLLTRNVILAPVFGIKKDVIAINALKCYFPHYNVVAVNCAALSMEGGLCNCVSWNIIE